MLLEEFGKRGDRNVKRVCTIVLLEVGVLGSTGDSSRLLERLDLGRRFGIDGKRQRAEGLSVRLVEESALLEKERDIRLASDLVRC